MSLADNEVVDRARAVRLVVLDVDGVLTDGSIHLSTAGRESRSFFVRDGLGIRLGQRGGLRFAIVSGRDSRLVTDRAAELGIEEIHQGVGDKASCLEAILTRQGLQAAASCFVGDDLIDVPAMRVAGLAAAPADAAPEAREAAQFVTASPGGRGAVREVIELVLRATGRWDEVIRPYLDGGR